jgi:FkbM family methyltransferase
VANLTNLRELFNQRLEKLITREQYWTSTQNFLKELAKFSELQEVHGNKIEISGNRIIIEMKATRTHGYSIKMLLDGQDVRSAPFSVLSDGFYEPFQSDILVELGKNSNHFLDIGASVGFYSLALMKANPTLKVDAFEPQPKVFDTMNYNIELNQLSTRMKTHNIGLGNIEDELTMFVPRFTGTSGASFKDLHEDEGESIKIIVPVRVLDTIFKTPPELIKIDVEGFELNVILGAQRIIESSNPTIVVELLRKWMKPFGHTPQMFLEKMFECNYICYAISEGSLSEIREINDNTKETNFIFVHESREEHKNILIRYAK